MLPFNRTSKRTNFKLIKILRKKYKLNFYFINYKLYNELNIEFI